MKPIPANPTLPRTSLTREDKCTDFHSNINSFQGAETLWPAGQPSPSPGEQGHSQSQMSLRVARSRHSRVHSGSQCASSANWTHRRPVAGGLSGPADSPASSRRRQEAGPLLGVSKEGEKEGAPESLSPRSGVPSLCGGQANREGSSGSERCPWHLLPEGTPMPQG